MRRPTDAWAKMFWADRHADALYRESQAFTEGNAGRIAHDIEAHSSDHVFWLDLAKEPPLREWGLIAGDVLHNLRSALDCLAWQLARINYRGEPPESEAHRINFPIRTKSEDFASAAVLPHVTDTHRMMLGNVQPYRRGYEPLARLAVLSNRDKHRVIQPTFLMHEDFKVTAEAVRDCEIAKIINQPPGPFKHRRELARVQITPTGPEPETEGHAKLSGYIALSDGTRLQHLLDEIGCVVRTVLDYFEPTISDVLL
jgi:hypothetical protein